MKQYLEALQYIIDNGEDVSDRTGVGTRSVFGYQMRFDLSKGFPAVTTKKLAWKAVVGELLWFIEGSTDERRLAEITYGKPRSELVDKTTIWTANANAQGKDLGYPNNSLVKELGPIYGFQWRNFDGTYDSMDNLNVYSKNDHELEYWNETNAISYGTDQLERLITDIKKNPDSRRLLLTSWNPNHTSYMALPPCHILAQFIVRNNKLSCLMYQRSVDTALGAPFNIASYSLLTHIIASICNLEVGDFVYSMGDMHLYQNHLDPIKEQLKREPLPLATLKMPKINSLSDLGKLSVNDFVLENYLCHDAIKMDMAV